MWIQFLKQMCFEMGPASVSRDLGPRTQALAWDPGPGRTWAWDLGPGLGPRDPEPGPKDPGPVSKH